MRGQRYGCVAAHMNSSSITRIVRGAERTKSKAASRSTASRRRDSSTGWVTITSRACSPMPRCTTDLIETPLLAEHLRHGREHAGLVGDVQVQVEGALDVLDQRQRAAAAPAAGRRRSSR